MNRWVGFCVAVTLGLAILAAACTNGQPAAPPVPDEDDRPGGVEGSVINAEGTPLADMRVFIVGGTAPFPEIAVETDELGRYSLGSVPAGTFDVAVFDRQGNRVGLANVEVSGGAATGRDFVVAATGTTPERPVLPRLPAMLLYRDGSPYEGRRVSYCWPSEVSGDTIVGICADGIAFEEPATMVQAVVGDTLVVEIDADDPPTELSLAVIEESTRSVVQRHDLGRGLPLTFGADLPAGGYYLHIMGFWTDGDVLFELKLEVAESE